MYMEIININSQFLSLGRRGRGMRLGRNVQEISTGYINVVFLFLKSEEIIEKY